MKEVKKRKAVILDIDGTACEVSSILHYIIGKPKHERDHDSFIAGSMSCPAKPEVLEWLASHMEAGAALLVLTGREERFRKQSESWVAKSVPWSWEAFKMAPDHDPRPGAETKRALYHELIEEGYEIIGAAEDRPDIVALWEELEIPDIFHVPGYESEPGRDAGRI